MNCLRSRSKAGLYHPLPIRRWIPHFPNCCFLFFFSGLALIQVASRKLYDESGDNGRCSPAPVLAAPSTINMIIDCRLFQCALLRNDRNGFFPKFRLISYSSIQKMMSTAAAFKSFAPTMDIRVQLKLPLLLVGDCLRLRLGHSI